MILESKRVQKLKKVENFRILELENSRISYIATSKRKVVEMILINQIVNQYANLY